MKLQYEVLGKKKSYCNNKSKEKNFGFTEVGLKYS